MAPSSSSLNWVYDVFLSFRGEDVRVAFRSHFLKELARKLITAFKDNEIERSHSLWPELVKAIRSSRIAVVIFSKNYASSSWCLNELLEIVNCKDQMVIPVFYGVDPSDVRNQTGDFGKIFEKTCENKTEEVKNQWKKALTDVANMLGYHSKNWDDEAKTIEELANDILSKLLQTSSEDFEDSVGIEDHIAKMSELLQLESEEVKMVGIWGSSGIGKTTIARALFNQISRHFQGIKYIDRAFISKSKTIYTQANADDHNMKLHLQESFLSEILRNKDIKIDHLGALKERLKHQKVLIIIDDLDDLMVLKALADRTQWFGSGSRIIVVTNDKHLLKAHAIDCIYEVSLPTAKCALKMLCQSAFMKNSAPKGFEKLVVEVARLAGSLPLGLNVLGSSLRGRDKEYWMDMLPKLQSGLDGKIEKTLRVSYDALGDEDDKAIFRHIACLFNHVEVTDVKLLLANSGLHVDIGLKNLVDKSLIRVRNGHVEMHRLLEKMGRKIVRGQSIHKPGEREFLVDSKDIVDVLSKGTGTQNVLGISLDIDEIDELHIHENAFKEMRELKFLEIYSKKWDQKKEVKWHLPESCNYLPDKLRLLRLDGYPMRDMPSNFCTENLVKLQMSGSKLERLWEGVHSLRGLKDIDLERCRNLKEIPNLSMATNLEKLNLEDCFSLVELPSTIKYLNKLNRLSTRGCINLETLPTGINLQSLFRLDLCNCRRLKIFPDISTNIGELLLNDTGIETFPSSLRLKKLKKFFLLTSEKLSRRVQPVTPLITMLPHSLEFLHLRFDPSLKEFPASIQNFTKLTNLSITDCINLETLPTGINFPFLIVLDLDGCSRLRTFPDLSTNIEVLFLERTGIEEVPWWIEKFSRLSTLFMNGCNKLHCVSLHISKLKDLMAVEFSDCGALTEATWNDSSNVVAAATDNIPSKLPVLEEASSSFPNNLISCFDFNINVSTVHIHPIPYSKNMMLSGEEVPSYFTYRTTGTSLTNIPLTNTFPSQPFVRFKACVVVDFKSCWYPEPGVYFYIYWRFKGSLELEPWYCILPYLPGYCNRDGIYLGIFELWFPLNEDNASLTEHYENVDIQLRLVKHSHSRSTIKEWGIRPTDDFSSRDPTWYRNNFPYVCKVDQDNAVNETEHNEESGDREKQEANQDYSGRTKDVILNL